GRALEGLPAGRPVVLLGTGLTAVDVVLALEEAGFRGAIHAVSRRGLLPQRHRVPSPAPSGAAGGPAAFGGWTARSLIAAIRAETGVVEALGGDWRSVVDGLRPHTSALWAALPEAERERLLRH